MATAIQAATGDDLGYEQKKAGHELEKKETRPPTLRKGGVVMMKNTNSHGFSFLLSPAALRVELLGAVALVLVAGRLLPGFATVLRQFSTFFFP